jgi:hypothetical protein
LKLGDTILLEFFVFAQSSFLAIPCRKIRICGILPSKLMKLTPDVHKGILVSNSSSLSCNVKLVWIRKISLEKPNFQLKLLNYLLVYRGIRA